MAERSTRGRTPSRSTEPVPATEQPAPAPASEQPPVSRSAPAPAVADSASLDDVGAGFVDVSLIPNELRDDVRVDVNLSTMQDGVGPEAHPVDSFTTPSAGAGAAGPTLEVPDGLGGTAGDRGSLPGKDLDLDPGYDLDALAGVGTTVDGRTPDTFEGQGDGSAADAMEGATSDGGYGPLQTIDSFDDAATVVGFGAGVAAFNPAAAPAAAFVGLAAGAWGAGRVIGETEPVEYGLQTSMDAIAEYFTQDSSGFGEGAPRTEGAEQTNNPDEGSALLGSDDHGSGAGVRTDGQSVEGENAETETSEGRPATSAPEDAAGDQAEGTYEGPRSPGSVTDDSITRSLLQGLGGQRGGDVDPDENFESFESIEVFDLQGSQVRPGEDSVGDGVHLDESAIDDPLAAAAPYFDEVDG